MIRTPIEWMAILHKFTEPKRSEIILQELYKLHPQRTYETVSEVNTRARCLANAIDAVLRLETGHP